MFIQEHRTQWPIRVMCLVLEVHPSGYYAWTKEQPHATCDEERAIVLEMREIHRKTKRATGSRRMRRQLRLKGLIVGRHRIQRLMREDGMRVVRTPRAFVVTTDSNHNDRIAPNLLDRKFEATKPNQKWCADFTYINTLSGFVYLAIVMDLFSRRIIGWCVSDVMTQDMTMTALKRAMKLRKNPKFVIVNTDRGSQYTADAYRTMLHTYDGIASMSRKGNPWERTRA